MCVGGGDQCQTYGLYSQGRAAIDARDGKKCRHGRLGEQVVEL